MDQPWALYDVHHSCMRLSDGSRIDSECADLYSEIGKAIREKIRLRALTPRAVFGTYGTHVLLTPCITLLLRHAMFSPPLLVG